MNHNTVADVEEQISLGELQRVRTEEVEELLGKPPSWLVRWSLWFMLGFLVGFGALLYYIRYPDVVVGEVLLSSNPPPLRLYPKAAGELRLFVRDQDKVPAGKVLALISNPTHYQDLQVLEKQLEAYQRKGFVAMLKPKAAKLRLGELQGAYQNFRLACQNWALYEGLGKSEVELAALSARIRQQQAINDTLEARYRLEMGLIEIQRNKFEVDSLLYQQGLNSNFEYWQANSEMLRQYQSLKSSEASLLADAVSLANMQADLRQQSLENHQKRQELALQTENAYQLLWSQIQVWKARYLLVAPYEAEVSFLDFWADYQFASGDQAILALIPERKSFVGKVQVSATNSEKIQLGQKVQVRLAQYPYQKFGVLEAFVSQVAAIPKANLQAQELQYTITIQLKNGLNTSEAKVISPQAEFWGEANIITENKNLLERLFTWL